MKYKVPLIPTGISFVLYSSVIFNLIFGTFIFIGVIS